MEATPKDITCSMKKSEQVHEFFKAVEAFKKAAERLTAAWNEMDGGVRTEDEDRVTEVINERAAQLFPFSNDFEQVTKDVRIWAEDLKGFYTHLQGVHITKK